MSILPKISLPKQLTHRGAVAVPEFFHGHVHGSANIHKQVRQAVLLLVVGNKLSGLVAHLFSTGHQDGVIGVVVHLRGRGTLKDQAAIKSPCVAFWGLFQTIDKIRKLVSDELIPQAPVFEAGFVFCRSMTQLM